MSTHVSIHMSMQEKMFAYCDTSGDRRIQEEEFVDAWAWIESQAY